MKTYARSFADKEKYTKISSEYSKQRNLISLCANEQIVYLISNRSHIMKEV